MGKYPELTGLGKILVGFTTASCGATYLRDQAFYTYSAVRILEKGKGIDKAEIKGDKP